jgi:hypothetical protein
LKNDANNLGAICGAVISKVEDWGSKVESNSNYNPALFSV